MPNVRSSLASLAALAFTLFAHGAGAQVDSSTQTVIRRGLIEAMQSASDRRDYALCIDSGRRAASIRDTGSLRHMIARCQLGANDYVAALGSAEECLSLLRRDASAVGRDTLVTQCQRVESEARAHTGRLTVTTPSPVPSGLSVTVNGRELPSVTWDIPTIVNAGATLEVRATAPGFVAFRGAVMVAPGSSAEVQVTLVAERPAAASITPPVVTQRPSVTIVPRPPGGSIGRPPPRQGPSPLLMSGAATAGVGVAAAVAGFALAAVAQGAYDGACAAPPTIERYEACVATRESAQSDVTARATVGYVGAGVAAIGTGLLIAGIFTARPTVERTSDARVVVAPVARSGFAGAIVAARW